MTFQNQNLAQRYPDAVRHLEELPQHLAEEVGDVAMVLTHVDMHPVKVEVHNGKEHADIDFDHVITDPEYDASQLEQDAVDAAQAGQEKLANVLHGSAELLSLAHKDLVDRGVKFGSDEAETDQSRFKRDAAEHEVVYKEAYRIAVEAALKAKADDRPEDAQKILESLLVLDHISHLPDRPLFRQIVQDGLADELLAAGQESRKILVGARYKNVAEDLSRARYLLQLSTGHNLDHDLAIDGEFDPDIGAHNVISDNALDLIFVASLPDSKITLQDAYDIASNSTLAIKFKERFGSSPEAAAEVNKIINDLTDISHDLDMLQNLLDYEDPAQFLQIAESFSLDLWEVKSIFGTPDQFAPPFSIDSERVKAMSQLKEEYPQYFEDLFEHTKAVGSYQSRKNSPLDVMNSIKALEDIEINNMGLLKGLWLADDLPKYIDTCGLIGRTLESRGMSFDELAELVLKVNGDPVLSSFVFGRIEMNDIHKAINNLLLKSEVMDVYQDMYSKYEYPLRSLKKTLEQPELDRLPHIKERLLNLGLSEDLSAAIFDSWATYSAFVLNNFSNQEGFQYPTESPSQDRLTYIARNQSRAMLQQLEAIETFAERHGRDTLNEVIATFGIYNFNRYKSFDIAAQNERWKQGVQAGNIVVNARSDWNSFTGSLFRFDQPLNDDAGGLFTFEANSGTEAARIAVLVGKHERDQGREPDVRRFIIYAHGSGQGMDMGTNDERIDLTAYHEAARKRSKIDGAEINDYKRHLGENFGVILQSCSTAEEGFGKNIAETISEQHRTTVTGSSVSISGLVIRGDGSVRYITDYTDLDPVTYRPTP